MLRDLRVDVTHSKQHQQAGLIDVQLKVLLVQDEHLFKSRVAESLHQDCHLFHQTEAAFKKASNLQPTCVEHMPQVQGRFVGRLLNKENDRGVLQPKCQLVGCEFKK